MNDNIYMQAKLLSNSIMEDAMLVAYAVVAIQGRVEDEVSANEAYRLYDRGWVKDRTERGLLKFSRKGKTDKSARIYSRFEIEALKRAEKRLSDAYAIMSERAQEIVGK